MSECRNLNCGYCGAEVYEINGYTYNHDSGGTGHDCADEIKAKLDAALLQNSELKAKLVAALCRCGSPGEVSLSLHVPSCEYWKAMEKRKDEGGNPWAPNLDVPAPKPYQRGDDVSDDAMMG
jgi:hypothetical protein